MANKHLPHDLAQMQSLPLEAKIIATRQRIKQWYEHWDGMVYVSFSGGKDSTVLKHIVDSMYGDVPALFVNTGLEYPEIQAFVKEVKAGKFDCFNADVEIVNPEMRFDEVVKKYGYPVASKEVSRRVYYAKKAIAENRQEGHGDYMKLMGLHKAPDGSRSQYNCENWSFLLNVDFPVSNECCQVMKKKPAKQYAKKTNRKPIIGTLAEESRLRYQKWIQHGCNSFEGNDASSQPLSFWTEQDILRYLKKYKVPYCQVYGDIVVVTDEEQFDGQVTTFDILNDYEAAQLKTTGCNRTGCIFCMFGAHLEKEPNRFQRLKETHPRQYDYCIGGGEMVDGQWLPNKEGLGLAKVLDCIGVDYK